MKKRLTRWIVALAVIAVGVSAIYWWERPPEGVTVTQKDIVEHMRRLGRLSTNPPPVYIPIDLKRPVRLAIGNLGLGGDSQNEKLQDLVLAQLTGAPGLELVERQSLENVLHELNLSMAGLVRAKDAVRAGKLLKADWFLLSTSAKVSGTNSIVVRIVDARTGIMRDAGVFSTEGPTMDSATDIARFVRDSRKNAAGSQPREFLAIGAFQDLSINRRQAAFPAQLRSYLMAAYQHSSVTLLEREAVDTLLQEVRLDLAGLADGSGTNDPQPMQSAYWLVDGAYQSYETTNFEVELVMNVSRIFGRHQQTDIRGQPDEALFAQVKSAIDWQMKTNATVIWQTGNGEARQQMLLGKELSKINSDLLAFPGGWETTDAAETARRRYNMGEAIRAFQTALLLEPANREAKLYLASCLRKWPFFRMDEARNYYREVIEEPVHDKWTDTAQMALHYSFQWESPEEKVKWFESASQQMTNSSAYEYYRREADLAEREITLSNRDSKAREIADKEVFQKIMDNSRSTIYGGLGTYEFLDAYGTNTAAAARRLIELYPSMKAQASNATPYVLAAVVAAQVSTNEPVVAEFQRLLDSYAEHPDDVAKSERFWQDIWRPLCNWSFEHKLYHMAATVLEDEKRATAFDPFHNFHIEDEEKITLAFAYLGSQEWQKALEIFETYSNRPVAPLGSGPWGKAFSVVQTSKQAAYCREKLGLPALLNPAEFDMGKPLLCMCTPSTFIADDQGLWIGIEGQLVRLSFDLETNFVVHLPIDPSTIITAISPGSSNVWIGTAGEGLIQYDQTTHQCTRFTVKNGLAMDSISCAQVQGDTLWIGYGSEGPNGGGLGSCGLSTHKFVFHTSSISGTAEVPKQVTGYAAGESATFPTRSAVLMLATGRSGDVWFASYNHPLGRYRSGKNAWGTLPGINGVSSLVADKNRLFAGHSWDSYTDAPGLIGLTLMNLNNLQPRSFGPIDGLPAVSVTAIALDGDQVWIGGRGYIAALDVESEKVRRLTYIQTRSVNRIQIGGGYVWAQFDWHLYRAPLNRL